MSKAITLNLSNTETRDFLKVLKMHSEDMKEYRPLTSQATTENKYAVIMAGTLLEEIRLRLLARYERYSTKPSFDLKLNRGEASAILTMLSIKPSPDVLQHVTVTQIGPYL